MENIWNIFKQRTLEMQHMFNNFIVQSYNQSTHPRENMIFNDLEDQQLQQAFALSMGQNVQNIPNYRNDIFPPPLPPSPNEYIREINQQEEMMQDEITPYEEDEEEMLRLAMQESLNEAKEKGLMKDDQKEPKIERNINNNNNNIGNYDMKDDDLDDIGQVIMQIRKERKERVNQEQRKKLINEQEEAYQESLYQDNLKKMEEQKKLQEMEEKQKELELKKEIEEAIILSKELSKKSKIEKVLNDIPIEPPKSEKDSVEIIVRLTDGTKVSRRFKNDNTLQHLHNWITSLSDQKQIPDLFSISSSFPRKKFTDLDQSFKDANLVGSVLLFIEEEEE